NEQPERIEDIELENLSGLRNIISKCLRKNTVERYQDFTEVIHDLNEVLTVGEAELRNRVQKLLLESKDYLKARDFKNALVTANDAAKLDPQNTNVHRHIDLIKKEEEKEHNRTVGKEKIDLAHELINEKKYENAVRLLSGFAFDESQQSEAKRLINLVKEAVKTDKENKRIDSLIINCKSCLEAKDYDNAARVADEILTIRPEHDEALELLIRIEEDRKKDLVEQQLEAVQALIESNQYEDAIEVLKNLQELVPKDAQVLELLNKAKQEFQKEKENVRINKLLKDGKNFLHQHDLVNTSKKAKEILELCPDYADAIKLLEAVQEKKQERFIEDRLRKAQRFIEDREYEKAINFLNNFLDDEPQHAEALKLIQEAKTIQKVAAENKKIANDKIQKAREHLRAKRYVNAVEILKIVIQLDANKKEARTLLKEAGKGIRERTESVIPGIDGERGAELVHTRLDEAKVKKTRLEVSDVGEIKKTRLRYEEVAISPEIPESKIPQRKKHLHQIYLVASAIAIIFVSYLGYQFFIASPIPRVGYVSLNISPWAKVTRIVNEEGSDVTHLINEGAEIVTPCCLSLQEGRYQIHVRNPKFKTVTLTIEVKNGETQEINQILSGFKYSGILSKL
ncbi:MAG: PEGA domain-containing protein, partial [bacterium]